MSKLVIWGASGHARVVADAVRKLAQYSVVGFLDDTPSRKGEHFAGAEILGGRNALVSLRAAGVTFVHIAVGDCRARVALAEVAETHGLKLCSVVHPSASVALDAEVGAGTFLAAGALLGAQARLGRCVIVNSRASVDHDCFVDDGAHVGPGVTLGGFAQIGKAAWLGIGATVRDRVAVGDGAIVGAGALVLRDIPAHVVAYGAPATVRRPV